MNLIIATRFNGTFGVEQLICVKFELVLIEKREVPPTGMAIRLDNPMATNNIEKPYEICLIPTTS